MPRSDVWPWLLVAATACIGVLLGAYLGRREASLFPLTTSEGSARPTIVVVNPPTATASSIAPTATAEYVVEPGDSLRSIAQQVWGDDDLWMRLYTYNQSAIGPDPDTLRPGTRLRIPPD